MLMYLSFSIYLYYSVGIMLLYYISVWFLFFFKKNTLLKPAKQAHSFKQTPDLTSLFDQSLAIPESNQNANDQFPLVHDLVDELNAMLLQLNTDKADKEQVLDALHRLLQKYSTLKNSAYQASINHLICIEAENKCGLHFSAEEMLACWT
ncbi:MAG: hypothetical protein J0I09_07885 [Sphingobacteriia bacterium]|nr:hypothetical protein [Sphingobacteriia bacterium]